ncbi:MULTISPECIES: hypothetical protein [Mycobacteriaceae]|uniref:hypothetical protein n=1 Tax=Mycobacteriaceae TaxID=1762 RepID=UPI001055A62B|nr:hypothetical protein [Mycolicibacter algericus]
MLLKPLLGVFVDVHTVEHRLGCADDRTIGVNAGTRRQGVGFGDHPVNLRQFGFHRALAGEYIIDLLVALTGNLGQAVTEIIHSVGNSAVGGAFGAAVVTNFP